MTFGGTLESHGGRRRTLTTVLSVIAAFSVLAGCSHKSAVKDQVSSRASDAARSAPLPVDLAFARGWMTERKARLDGFATATSATLIDGACMAQAEGIRSAVGDFTAWMAEVTGAPDPVLSDSLLAATLAARGTIAACAGDRAALDEQRGDLRRALDAVSARRERLEKA